MIEEPKLNPEALSALYEALEVCQRLLLDLCPRIPHDGPRDADEQEEYERIGFPLSQANRALALARGEP